MMNGKELSVETCSDDREVFHPLVGEMGGLSSTVLHLGRLDVNDIDFVFSSHLIGNTT